MDSLEGPPALRHFRPLPRAPQGPEDVGAACGAEAEPHTAS